MIKIEHTEVFGWEAAIRGMRNPLNSWAKMDSCHCDPNDCPHIENGTEPAKECDNGECGFCVGENDLGLMKKLARAGDDHGKVLRYLDVYVDIDAPLYWWKEFRTYRKGRKFMDDGDGFLDPDELELHIETNSCSTMHKIQAKEFTLEDFSCEHLMDEAKYILSSTIGILNLCREQFNETKDKKWWWQMIQLLPSSYNQKRTVKMNYQCLKNMYHARKNHKLDEWHDFCAWCESLPYFTELCCE